MNLPGDLWNDRGSDTERLVFFSDAVFAVALTLLVIDLRVPVGATPATLPSKLGALWPQVLALLISFVVIASYWRGHHRIFHLIERYDRWLIVLNFAFLLSIVLQPFTTSLTSEYGNQPLVMGLYAALLGVSGLLLTALWVYAVWAKLVNAEVVTPKLARFYAARSLAPTVLFLASAGLALVIEPLWVPWLWILLLPIQRGIRWYFARAASPAPPRPAPAAS
ncbi:MAG: DUF1211 domain-containing protein [Chloroflexota bacterium]|nr:DUF1211 domain-containing protein [Chloroflexota bacterium]